MREGFGRGPQCLDSVTTQSFIIHKVDRNIINVVYNIGTTL